MNNVHRASRCLAAALVIAVIADEWEVRSLDLDRPSVRDQIVVIGDSLSAGLDEPPAQPWPVHLSERLNVSVANLAQPGATVREAMSQARRMPAHNSTTVLIEIGGNDLLSGRPARVFQEELEELFQQLQHPDRQLILLELPLPPFCQGYGRAQRDLARRFGAALIPRRRWASVVFSQEATVDGLHYSIRGHHRMAGMVAQFLVGD